MKKIKYLFTLIITLSVSTNIVLANTNNVVDFDKLGTIEINLKESINKESINGAEITIYQIATVTEKDNNLLYVYNENIKDCQADLSDLSNNNLVSEISNCITIQNTPTQTKLTNNEGTVKFENLSLGLYLITQTNTVSGYSKIDSFLVTIPKEENNIWIYDIKASPKTDIIRLFDISVEKRWDIVNGNNTPDKVTIQLLKNNEVIDTIILNNENDWNYTWKQIEQSDEYSVKEIDIPAGYTATYRQVGNNFIVTNTKTLVQTGQNIIIIELLSILGLIFIITGIICEKRKKYE